MSVTNLSVKKIQSRRIALFCEINVIGGVDTFIHTLVNAWPIEDDQFTVLCNSDYPGLARLGDNLDTPHTLVSHEFNRLSAYSRKTLKNMSNRVLRKLLVYFFVLARYSNFLFLVIRIKKTLIRGNFDRIIVVNGGYPGGDTCRAASIAWGKIGKSATGIHSFHSFAGETPKYARWAEYLIDCVLRDSGAVLVTVSGQCSESLRSREAFRQLQKVDFIYNGIKEPQIVAPEEKDAFRRECGISGDQPLLVMLASYLERKGHEFLFDAFRLVIEQRADCRLIVCGDGEEADFERVSVLLQRSGLSQFIKLLKFREDAHLVIAAGDLVVVPSQLEESFGLVIVEAMAAGKPVVATSVGGIPEILEDGIGGYLCGSSDVVCFASKILKIIDDPKLASRIGYLGSTLYKSMFTANLMALQYAKLLK